MTSYIYPKTKETLIYICIILFIASFLRIYQLGNIHSGFFADEAINAYDSYSILKTGKNIWGETYPLFFNHHDVDSVSGIYIYSSIPFIYFFGLNEFSARLTAALYGILTVIVTYFFVKELSKNSKIALIASFLLAISPWHLLFSRVALRGITLPFFFLLGVYFLLKGHRLVKHSILSGLILGICFYTYSVVKLFLPLFLIGYVFIYKRELYRHKRNALSCFLIMSVVTIPAFIFSLSEAGAHRFKALSIFSQKNVEQTRENLEASHSIKRQLNHLPDIGISGLMFAKNYLTFYSPKFLFSKQWNVGEYLLYWFELPFILLGLFLLFQHKNHRHKIILWWFVIYCIPTSLTVPGTVSHRAINGLPVFQIIAAYGLYYFFTLPIFKIGRRVVVVMSIFLVLALCNIYTSLYHYFVIYPRNSGEHWQYGFRDTISYTESVKKEFNEIIFSQNLHNAYALLLFYLKYDPERYLANPPMTILKIPQNIWLKLHEIDIYKIKDIEKVYEPDQKNLYVVKPWELTNVKPRKIIYHLDGTPAIKII